MSRRRDVLGALRAADGKTVSGEALASELGVSRVAVAKHIRRLRDEGYDIVAERGVGYRLAASRDALSAEEVRSRVASPLVREIVGGPKTASTNDDARALALAGSDEIAVALAARQTAGRGRLGRSWASPTGGVYLSFVLRPQRPLAELTVLPLVVSVGVARGLGDLGIDVGLKWPNDVVLGDRKLAGVLLEMAAEADRAQWVIAGVGVNVRRKPQSDADFVSVPVGAAFVDDVAPDVALAHAASAVIEGVAEAYSDFLAGDFASLRSEYEGRHVLNGREVLVSDLSGRRVAEGTVQGVDDLGRLLVLTRSGVVPVAAGDVTVAR